MIFFEKYRPNILLYLGKFPGYGFDVDGGSILAHQLIEILKVNSNLTLVFIRKNRETYTDSQVKEIKYVEYKNPYGNKFERRLQNLDTNRKAIGNFSKYDIIITAHTSKFFGFEDAPLSFWKKTILFPMFCTSSYKRAGECVPKEYTNLERFVINNVGKIITPSVIEMNDLRRDYGIDTQKVSVIYRGIDSIFEFKLRPHDLRSPKIVCIGSIKKQKNNLAALVVLNSLLKSGANVTLDFICTIQDENLYDEMLTYIKNEDLTTKVNFHFEQTQEQVANILREADINVSVSNWETFGRGIFEGISCGLPTFVFSRLKGVRIICGNNPGVIFVENEKDMSRLIGSIINSPATYYQMSEALKPLAENVSYEKEKNDLIKLILNDYI